MKRLLKRKTAVFGLFLILMVVIAALLAPVLAPHDPNLQNLGKRLTPPAWSPQGSMDYPLGTDGLGRDLLSRLIYGSRISLLVGVLSTVISATLGTVLGLIWGYYGGWADRIIGRLTEIQLAFPFILLTIAIIAALGPGLKNMVLVFGIANFVVYARTTRGVVLTVKQKEFIEAARVIGTPDFKIILWHIFPNVLSPILVIATLSMAEIIISESSLSFLGLGVDPEIPTWGRMLSEGRNYLTNGWWVATFPGLAIMMTVLGINLVGDGLRDALDPRMGKVDP